MAVVLTNNATSLLAAAITAGATTLSVENADAGKFPAPAAGDWFPVTVVDNAGNMEIMRATARNGAIITVTRAQEGTLAKAFPAGSRVDVRLTAEALSAFFRTGFTSIGGIQVKYKAGFGGVQLASGDENNTGYIEGFLPNGKRGWYVGWAADNGRAALLAENGVQGYHVYGDLIVEKSVTINAELRSIGSVVIRGSSDNTGNIHTWYRNFDQSISHAVTYWERSTGDFIISTGGSNHRFQPNGQIWAGSDLVARGVVYAGSGNAQLTTNGNVTGSLWSNWGAGDAFTAIQNRIESRAWDIGNERAYAHAISQVRELCYAARLSLMWCRPGGQINPNDLIAGANLRYAGLAAGGSNNDRVTVQSTFAADGTWRMLGFCGVNPFPQGNYGNLILCAKVI